MWVDRQLGSRNKHLLIPHVRTMHAAKPVGHTLGLSGGPWLVAWVNLWQEGASLCSPLPAMGKCWGSCQPHGVAVGPQRSCAGED